MAEERYISKIRIENIEYDIKDEELREGLDKLLGPQDELNIQAKDD